ncbi:hypothetical protein OAX12_02395 [Candidatus Pelagibacter sp.]|jgi:hypothetical protein|nr:hypothetical protein [Candidatus Pelagibacter sp.]
MKKLFLIIGMLSVLVSTSQASEWNIVASELIGYNFYVDKAFLGENF